MRKERINSSIPTITSKSICNDHIDPRDEYMLAPDGKETQKLTDYLLNIGADTPIKNDNIGTTVMDQEKVQIIDKQENNSIMLDKEESQDKLQDKAWQDKCLNYY